MVAQEDATLSIDLQKKKMEEKWSHEESVLKNKKEKTSEIVSSGATVTPRF